MKTGGEQGNEDAGRSIGIDHVREMGTAAAGAPLLGRWTWAERVGEGATDPRPRRLSDGSVALRNQGRTTLVEATMGLARKVATELARWRMAC